MNILSKIKTFFNWPRKSRFRFIEGTRVREGDYIEIWKKHKNYDLFHKCGYVEYDKNNRQFFVEGYEIRSPATGKTKTMLNGKYEYSLPKNSKKSGAENFNYYLEGVFLSQGGIDKKIENVKSFSESFEFDMSKFEEKIEAEIETDDGINIFKGNDYCILKFGEKTYYSVISHDDFKIVAKFIQTP